MHDFLMSLISWGTDAVAWVQGFRTPALDVFFKGLTFMGQQEFYLLLLPFVYWVIDRSLGVRLVFALLPGVYLNDWLKTLFFTPRPDPARVARLVEETTYAFPSGHAQNSTVVFGLLAAPARRWLAWALAALLIGAIALSRIYLGVHHPQDVLGGFFFGAIYLALFFWVEKQARAWYSGQRLAVRLGLVFLGPILLLLLHPTKDTVAAMASLAGLGVACVLEREWVCFEVGGEWPRRALRFLAGIAMALVVYLGLRALFPDGLFFRSLRYACVGLTVGLLAPWVFVKTGLAASEGEQMTEAPR
jgi:membrane-associated phospholipid phosphatase